MCAIKKVTKETRRWPRAGAAHRCPALLGPSRDGAGTRCAQTPAPLRPRRTCGARLAQGGMEGQDQRQRHPRMAWIYWVQLRLLTLGPPYREPSIAGESGAKRRRCLSAASSAPSPDSPRSAGYRCAAPARGQRRVSLVTFFARAKKVTPLRRRGKGQPGTPGEPIQSFPRAIAWNTPSRRTHRWNSAAPTCISTVANNT